MADVYINCRNTSDALQKIYDQCNFGQQAPTFDNLVVILEAVVPGFNDLYLVIDLDECPKNDGEREKLLGVIESVNS